jgi:TonB-dependent receptor
MLLNKYTNRKTALACSTAFGAMAIFAPAHAQEAQATEEPQEIVVAGAIREAQEASVEAKRAASNIVDIASADSIGRFPDQSSADALSRLPGVAVQRDQGQARYIQVRGAPNRWTSVSIDGIPQTGVDEGGDTRAYRFDAVPAVLLSEMRINKSLTPDITAEAITANIDLRTYSPLSEDGLKVTGDIGYGFMDLSDGPQRQGSLRAGWSNGTWAFALGGSHYQRKQVTDNREASYDELGRPTDIDVRNYKLKRENNGLFGTIEFSPADGQRFYVRGIYTEFNDDEQRNAYQFELADAVSGTRGALTGDLVGVPVTGDFNYGRYRNKNYVASAGMDFDNGNGTEYKVALGFTRTENSTDLPMVHGETSDLNSPSLSYDRTEDGRFPVVTLYQTIVGSGGAPARGPSIPAFDQTSFDVASSTARPILQDVVSNAYTAKFDMRTELGDLEVRSGLLGSIRDIKGNTIGLGGQVPLGPTGFNMNDYVTGKPWDTNFPLGFTPTYVDNVALNKDLQATFDRIGFDPASVVLPTSFYNQTESILAGYVMGAFDLGEMKLTGGARVEYYGLENSGTALINRVPTPLSTKNDHFDVFPSLSARYDVSDNLVLRLAGQRGVSRPAYAAVRVGASISDTADTISGGNPALRPEYTWGLDGSVEYYLPGGGLISVAGFYRWVDDVLYQSQQPVNSDIFNSPGFDRSAYRLTSTFNGSDGKLYGVEFNVQQQFTFLPGFLDGFGVQGNLTLLDGDFKALQPDGSTARSPFQGMSDTIVNASLYYEKYGISALVSYQWRSEYLDTLGGLGSGEYRDGYDNLDVSVRYAVTDNFTVFADLANLTDAIYVAYEGTPETPTEVEQIGARYMFGVRFNF